MMDLSEKQWVKHVIFHPFEGFEDMRWKKSGSVRIAFVIVFLLFAGLIVNDRLFAFHFHNNYDRIFNIVPYFVRSVVFFAAWVIGNWSVCTLLDGEGTLRKICIFSAYSLVPYTVSLYLTTLLSHILIREEAVFIDCILYIGTGWSIVLLFNAIKAVHQYSAAKTLWAVVLTIASMFVILMLAVLVMTLFQKVGVFIFSLYTEIRYRLRT